MIDEIAASQKTALEWNSSDLLEVSGMLEQRIEIWKQEARQAGEAYGLERGRAEGKAEGKAEGIYQVALTMKRKGMPLDQIAELTGLSMVDIEKLT